jgi:hypothetical protein
MLLRNTNQEKEKNQSILMCNPLKLIRNQLEVAHGLIVKADSEVLHEDLLLNNGRKETLKYQRVFGGILTLPLLDSELCALRLHPHPRNKNYIGIKKQKK